MAPSSETAAMLRESNRAMREHLDRSRDIVGRDLAYQTSRIDLESALHRSQTLRPTGDLNLARDSQALAIETQDREGTVVDHALR